MPHSAIKRVQILADVLEQMGVRRIVISPGSRNGPLTTAFVHRESFTCYSIVDERSAGFFALGMALESKEMTAVCCTSGSASVNYYPAVVEAFYQSLPLLVLTADRPAEMVDQFDGQTIRQWGVFAKHVQFNLQWDAEPGSVNHQDQLKEMANAIQMAQQLRTPIHINIPLSEPLYELQEGNLERIDLKTQKIKPPEEVLTEKDKAIWCSAERRLVLVGKSYHDLGFSEEVAALARDGNTVVLVESTSNAQVPEAIGSLDNLLFNWEDLDIEALRPDLLLTLGQNVVSKKVKQFLRSVVPKNYWHVDSFFKAETYGKVSRHFKTTNIKIASQLNALKKRKEHSPFVTAWGSLQLENQKAKDVYLESIPFCDLWVHKNIIEKLPENCTVHYGNSSPIRYSQLFLFPFQNAIHCNRGTSGIEGSTSTAIGAASAADNPHVLVTGDISFFYEMNALWNTYIPSDFRIILINNSGGNIFEIIPGPSQTGALEPYFTTPHNLNAKALCGMFGWIYKKVGNSEQFDAEISDFWNKSEAPQLLEVNTASANNAEILRAYFRKK